MKIVSVKDTQIEYSPYKVDVRKLYDEDSAYAMHIVLQPGEALKPHITPVDVFFYILEGAPEVLIGDENIQVQIDSLVESPKNVVHCINNKSNTTVRILVVKALKPTTQSKLL